MEDDNVSPELPQEHHNAEVKMETQDEPKKSPQPIPLTPSFTPGETIDLLSDGEQEPTAAGFSTTAMDVQPAAEPSDGFASDENAENRVDSRLTHEQIVAKQKEMADKFRTQKQKGAKNLASPLRSEAKESEDDDPAATFAEEKKIYNRKKKANTLTMEDEIRFMKIESSEMARIRKKEADEEFDRTPPPEESDGLFVSDKEEPAALKYSDLHSEDEAKTPKKRGRPLKGQYDDGPPPKKRAKKGKKVAGADYTQEEVDFVLQISRQPSTKANPKEKANTKPKKSGVPKSKAKATRGRQPVMTNVHSLFGNDVFGDAAATAGLAAQPQMLADQTRKNDALKQLIASVPEEDVGIARSDKRYLDDAMKAFTGTGSVKPAPDGEGWIVKGMKTSMKHYQILGVSFMRKRENDTNLPKGGILADEMGLGKTIMMLANIVNGKPKEKGRAKATLIVASPALVTQWMQEIRSHCDSKLENKHHGLGRVMQYRAGSRLNSNDDAGLIEEMDIVLTTYTEVQKSYPKQVFPPELVTAEQKDAYWKEVLEKERGILHRIRFLRVVLDEAQAIKNHRSQTSISCRALDAKHHWAITGTPIQNSISEFYPYFKFLREPNTGSYKIYKENFCSPDDPDGIQKLNVFLRKFMIRRTHIDRFMNARLLDLPTPTEHTVWLEFHEVERTLYELVKKRFIERINCLSQQGQATLQKSYSHIWTMILRLRQLCSHILLAQGQICDLLRREDFEKLNKLTESEDEQTEEGEALLVHLRNVLNSDVATKTIEGGIGSSVIKENETLAIGSIDIGNTKGLTGGKHGINFRFRKYLEQLQKSDHWDAIVERTQCCGCCQPPEEPYITSCFHIFCHACLRDLQHLAARRGHDQARCSECGEAYTYSQPCEGLENFQNRETSASTDHHPKKSTKSNWISIRGEVLPSAKTRATKAALINFFKEDPEGKCIVYTQFIPMIRILGKVCQTEKWGFCQYTGNMSHESRDKSINEFADNPNKRVLLASLKCGGLGLNLTMASRVLLLDPWWNRAVEQQAFCRVFRIGQHKETSMTRFVVKNTIDCAMMAMKERKQIEIDEVMNSSKMREKLSVEDLMRLFGKVGEDDEGKPFIFADGPNGYDEDEHLRVPRPDEDDEERFMGNEE